MNNQRTKEPQKRNQTPKGNKNTKKTVLPRVTPPVTGWTSKHRSQSPITQGHIPQSYGEDQMQRACVRFWASLQRPTVLNVLNLKQIVYTPTFVSVVGGPAVGKSSTVRSFMHTTCPGLHWRLIDKDHLLRWFSTYRRWNRGDDDSVYRPLTKRFARLLMTEGIGRRASMVYVGTGSDVRFTLEWLNRASRAGYRTILLDVRCSDEAEWLGRIRARQALGLHPAAPLRDTGCRRIAALVQRHRARYHNWATTAARASLHVVDTAPHKPKPLNGVVRF